MLTFIKHLWNKLSCNHTTKYDKATEE